LPNPSNFHLRKVSPWKVLGLTLASIALASVFNPHISADNPPKAANVNEARVAADAAEGANWLLNGRTFDSAHFSPLKQINDQNAGTLGLAWYMDIDSGMGIVSEPIVVDGIAYISAPQSKVYAIGAASGKLIWKFDPKVRLDQALNGSYSARTNAGVAVWEGKVFVGTGDCRLVAIDAASGKQIWETQVCEPTQTGITNAPHLAKGKVFMGYNRSRLTTPTPEKNCGASGPSPAIRKSRSNRKPSKKLPRKPGRPAMPGKSAAVTCGPRSPMTPSPTS
jgi:glucose dehydrogenase